MKTVEEIVYKNSHDTPDGLEIYFGDIHKVVAELKVNTKEITLQMLKYCFDNVGNKDINIDREIEKLLNPQNKAQNE